jgi:hypothetical protein
MRTFRLLSIAALAAGVGHTQAQITQVGATNAHLITLRSLNSWVKLMEGFNPDATSITLYNPDLSVYQVLNYPAPPAGMQWGNMSYVTEDLFDTDPATIEFVLTAFGVGGGAVYIGRGDGTQLFLQNPGTITFGSLNGLNEFAPIFSYGGQAYMVVYDNGNINAPSRVFALPGTLPCMDCSGFPNSLIMGGVDGGNVGAGAEMQLFPNPAGERATLLLGEAQVDAITMLDAAGRLVYSRNHGLGSAVVLDLKGFAAGTYTVVAEFKGQRIASLPLVVAAK